MNEHRYENENKIYLRVTALFHEDGRLLPVSFFLPDGRKIRIDRVTDMRPAISLKAGGMGIRYRCIVCGRPFYLFYEEDRWFIERDGAALAAGDLP